jgi:leucyl/phenylalanyl-tRNA--protein transferase
VIRVRERPPLYLLDENCHFPDPRQIGQEDLVAVGGDFSAVRLIEAYRKGIFPWFIEEELIYWFSPNPRMVLFPGHLNISKSLSKTIKKKRFDVTMNRDFAGVIGKCASTRRKGVHEGSWITQEFIEGFTRLHEMGIAYSFESYAGGELVGGLYGLRLGDAFFGESMFSEVSDASKVALCSLDRFCQEESIHFIDCQVATAHLVRMGAVEVSREVFYEMVQKAV